MNLIKKLAVLLFLAFAFSGCASQRPTKNVLDMVKNNSSCSDAAKALIVVLPGLYDSPEDVVNNGFIEAVRKAGINADIVIPDLHFGYYNDRSAVVRLKEDVFSALKNKPYQQVWLAGISLGGFGSVLYAQRHVEEIDGILMIAPYLGEQQVQLEISDAGGLEKWDAGQSQSPDHEKELWLWLRDHVKVKGKGGRPPILYLGYGTEDRFANGNSMLAATLPESRVFTTNGGHEWKPWLQVWERFLAQSSLPVCSR